MTDPFPPHHNHDDARGLAAFGAIRLSDNVLAILSLVAAHDGVSPNEWLARAVAERGQQIGLTGLKTEQDRLRETTVLYLDCDERRALGLSNALERARAEQAKLRQSLLQAPSGRPLGDAATTPKRDRASAPLRGTDGGKATLEGKQT